MVARLDAFGCPRPGAAITEARLTNIAPDMSFSDGGAELKCRRGSSAPLVCAAFPGLPFSFLAVVTVVLWRVNFVARLGFCFCFTVIAVFPPPKALGVVPPPASREAASSIACHVWSPLGEDFGRRKSFMIDSTIIMNSMKLALASVKPTNSENIVVRRSCFDAWSLLVDHPASWHSLMKPCKKSSPFLAKRSKARHILRSKRLAAGESQPTISQSSVITSSSLPPALCVALAASCSIASNVTAPKHGCSPLSVDNNSVSASWKRRTSCERSLSLKGRLLVHPTSAPPSTSSSSEKLPRENRLRC
mmetsp:Transcript_66986/g.187035  ORF Transcript_66986/g.187035 Transcript_66986/m.187035 type:complete len:305 (-) Transcript_66986:1714-2628(-)